MLRVSSSLLQHRRAPFWLACIGSLLALPSLFGGLQGDDYYHRAVLRGEVHYAAIAPTRFRMFTFHNGDPARTLTAIDEGLAVWWVDPHLKVDFLRPGSVITHMVDYALWPRTPWLMHLHSIGWFAACVLLMTRLLRRLFLHVRHASWVAGLAALMWTVDGTHGVPVGWLAQRNTLVSTAFALAALLLHDRARRDGSRRARYWSPVALLGALLAGEGALSVIGYLVAYAGFLDDAPRRDRMLSVVPHFAVVVAWALGYRLLHFGAHGSGVYLDPVGDPLRFLRALVVRLPVNLSGELGAPPPDLHLLFPPALATAMVAIDIIAVVVAMVFLVPLLRTNRLARFFAIGALCAMLPACATAPSSRLLFLAGFGLLGLLAQQCATLLEGSRRAWPVRAWTTCMLGSHLLLGPVLFSLTTMQMLAVQRVTDRLTADIPQADATLSRRLVIVNPPDATFTWAASLIRLAHNEALRASLLGLAVGTRDVDLFRTDASTLVVHQEGGFIVSERERLRRDPSTLMPIGTQVRLTGVTIEVLATTLDHGPSVVAARFAAPLEDRSLQWMRWDGAHLVPFLPPAIGERMRLPGHSLSL